MCWFLLLLTFLWLALAQANINSTNVNGLSYPGGNGDIRFHFDDSVQHGCQTVIMMGVGTGMSVDDYDKLANEVVRGSSIVFIMTDPHPRNPTIIPDREAPDPLKNCHEKDFAQFALNITKRLSNLIHVCRGTNSKPRFFVGGHSASGQSAIGALSYMYEQQFYPHGFIGLDPDSSFTPWDIPLRVCPFNFTGLGKLPVTLNIGFERGTCWVNPAESAAFVYNNSKNTSRVLIKIKNPESTSINHCSFTDNNCPRPIFELELGIIFCGRWNEQRSALVRKTAAEAIRVLAEATGSADPAAYKAIAVDGLEFCVAVNNDSVPVCASYEVASEL
jgi:hypothetical protein